MSSKTTISPDFEKFQQQIMELVDNTALRHRILLRAVLELKDRAALEPELGPWNREPGSNGRGVWYQRKFGARWRRKRDGMLNGRNTSENFQLSWQTEVQTKDEFSASAFTRVSYAPYLIDREHRVSWAASHGWLTTDEIARDYTDRFGEVILDEIDKQVDKW